MSFINLYSYGNISWSLLSQLSRSVTVDEESTRKYVYQTKILFYFSNYEYNLHILVLMSSTRLSLSIIITFSILTLILILIILILIMVLMLTRHRSIQSSNQISNPNTCSSINPHRSMMSNSKSSDIFSYRYDFRLISKGLKSSKPILSSSSNYPLKSIEQTSTHSAIKTNSSNNEFDPVMWNEDETLILPLSTSSNDDDNKHELVSTNNNTIHQQQSSHPHFEIMTGPPTIIYV